MSVIFFWLDWPWPYRILYSLGILLFLSCLGALGYAFYLGDSQSIFWTTEGSIDAVKVPFDYFEKHLLEFPIQTDAYLISEKFVATNFQLIKWAPKLYFLGIVIALLLILTAISDLSLTYYGVGLAFVMLFIANLNLEQLQVGEDIMDRWLLILAFVGYAPLSYLFFSYWTRASYVLRLLIYSAITVALFFYASTETSLQAPFASMLAQSMAFPIIAVAGICLFAGYEIMRGLLFIVTNGASAPKQRTARLIFLSIIYLGNLGYGLAYMEYNVDLGVYFLHPTLVFLLTLLIGLWGLRERAESLHKIMPFAPTGAFLYLGLGILCSLSVAYASFIGNEALTEVYQTIIIQSHIGLGIGFLAYIYFNFKPIINAGKKVHLIFYKPPKLSFIFAWAFGTALIVGLQFGENFFIYDQSLAAYHTSVADAAALGGDNYEAKQYYNIAKTYDPVNYHLHYKLGSMAKAEGQKEAAYFFFKNGVARDGAPEAYAQMSALNQKQGFSFQALYDLKDGIERFPNSGELLNNMGLMFTKTDVADSAYVYFKLARENSSRPEVVESNIFSLLTKYDFQLELDSLYEQWKPLPYVGTYANELAYLTKAGLLSNRPLDPDFLQDSVLTTASLCYIYNQVLNTALQGDTSAVPYLQQYLKVIDNEPFDVYLYHALSHVLYQQGEYQQAFSNLHQANLEAGSMDPYYPYLLGLRYFEHEQYAQAKKYLKQAYTRGNAKAVFPLALATSELGDTEEALAYWEWLSLNSPNESHQSIALNMRSILEGELTNLIRSNERLLYLFLHFRGRFLENEHFDELVSIIRDQRIKVRAIVERANAFTSQKDWAQAGLYLNQLTQLNLGEELMPYFQQAYLQYTFAQGKLDGNFFQQAQEAAYPRYHLGLRNLYMGAYYQSKQQQDLAIEAYLEGISKMPYQSGLYLRLAGIYNAQEEGDKAYDILLEGSEANPENTELLKAYCIQALSSGLDSYAEYWLDRLSALLSDAEYKAFEGVYRAKQAAMEKMLEDWQ